MPERIRFKSLVAKNIKACRLRLNLSQSQLAQKAQVSVRYVQQLERAPDKNLILETIEEVANALGVAPSVLTSAGTHERLSKREAESLELAIRLLQGFKETA